MSAPGEWLRRVWYLLNRGRLENSLREEMAAHREMMDLTVRISARSLLGLDMDADQDIVRAGAESLRSGITGAGS